MRLRGCVWKLTSTGTAQDSALPCTAGEVWGAEPPSVPWHSPIYIMFYIYKDVLYFPLHLIFYCWCFCPGRFSSAAFYYTFWTQGAKSYYQRTAGHVGCSGSLQQSAAWSRGGQLAASAMAVSKLKSYYVYLAPTSETVVNYFGNSTLGLTLQIFSPGSPD